MSESSEPVNLEVTGPTVEQAATDALDVLFPERMNRFTEVRKLPVQVGACPWDGTTEQLDALGVRWQHTSDGVSVEIWNDKEHCWVRLPDGHVVMRGIDGEHYPCDPDVLARTYERAGL